MRNFKLLTIWTVFLVISTQILASPKVFTDGPYIFYGRNGKVRVIDENSDNTYKSIDSIKNFTVSDRSQNYNFNVSLHTELSSVNQSQIRTNIPNKIFALSDAHGNFKHFIELLQKNEIIDKELNWIFKNNHLVIIGDVFDRGDDVLTILWYIYQLEQQAAKANGIVHYIIGNHDNMVLRNDLRYCDKKYIALAEKYKKDFSYFFNEESELGRWLRSKNTIQIIGDYMFVHAGISLEFYNSGISIDECNNLITKYISTPKNKYHQLSKKVKSKVELLFGSDGPLWYRGLVVNDSKYKPLDSTNLDVILNYFNIKTIVVGHTTFSQITKHYDGKVISIDTEDKKTKHPHLYQGLMINNF